MKLMTANVALMVSLACLAAPAGATTIYFSGTVASVYGFTGPASIADGQTITGQFLIPSAERAATAFDASAGCVVACGFQIRFTSNVAAFDGVIMFSAPTPPVITVTHVPNVADNFTVTGNLANTNGGSATITGQNKQGTTFNSSSPSELTALALSGDLSAFGTKTIGLTLFNDGVWGSCNPRCDVSASLDSLSLTQATPVPEPNSALLLIGGLGMCVLCTPHALERIFH